MIKSFIIKIVQNLIDFSKLNEFPLTDLGDDASVQMRLKESALYLTINRPQQRNSMTQQVMELLGQGMDLADVNPHVKVVVIEGQGDKAFCAGADLGGNSMMSSTGDSMMIKQHEAKGQLPLLFDKMWNLGKPIVAKVSGYAVAGGFGLALACDFIVAADNAVFGATEVKVGLWPFMITVPILRSIPVKLALELMMTGRRIDVFEAQGLGFINKLCKLEDIEKTLEAFIDPLKLAPPVAVRYGKKSFYAVEHMDYQKALMLLQSHLSVVSYSRDAAEGISAFIDKRDPEFYGY